ncbi:MAG TPA: DMT family transporter [Burkholderiales bacterium]|nr:DMT family transporter [Burkholderiales bacterium]
MTAVLFAALLHAAWNAIVKSSPDKQLDTVLVTAGAATVSIVTLFFLPVPAPQSWGYLAASALIHVAYFALVAAAYRTGDLSYVYPIMRGSAPLLTAVAAGLLLAEPLGIGGWSGIVLISAGILLLAANQWRQGKFDAPQTLFALGNALVICIYTLVDGIGTRLSGNAFSYVGWMLAFNAILLVALAAWRRPEALVAHARERWKLGLAGGACTWASYAIALWAMTQAPLAAVAALRETSVIFGTILAAVVLKERFGATRYAAALLVCAGAAALRI